MGKSQKVLSRCLGRAGHHVGPTCGGIVTKTRRGRCISQDFPWKPWNELISRKVGGIGCDTMSVDRGASEEFAVHRLALGAGLYHLENLSDLSDLPEAGASLVVAPIKLEGGSGGAVRVFALLP